MMRHDVDVIILGAGFSGSLLAQILCRRGRSVVLMDNRSHPRFAIGESSTPSANLILKELARRYDLKHIQPLSSYGSWQQAYPEIGCGVKRGFSYFKHQCGQEFQSDEQHENELLVAASSEDFQSDTHWFRQDVDALFCRLAAELGSVVLDCSEITCMDYDPAAAAKWKVEVSRKGQPVHLQAAFVVDATGPAGVLKQFLEIPDQTDQLQTRTSAIYSHFRQVNSWHDDLLLENPSIEDHPFCCDHSAQHHLLEGSWFWMLRFNQEITSVGLVINQTGRRAGSFSVDVGSWKGTLEQYPSMDRLLGQATIVDPPGKLLVASQLQRMCGQAAGADWAMLPHTAGFIDPLHSTGIAHALCGVEKLAAILDQFWDTNERVPALRAYQQQLFQELRMIDRLVYGCYRAMDHFPWFVSFSMLYFVAAIRYERSRLEAVQKDFQGAFLGADQPEWSQTVDLVLNWLQRDLDRGDLGEERAREFQKAVWKVLKPFDPIGLSSPQVQHMYPHTATL